MNEFYISEEMNKCLSNGIMKLIREAIKDCSLHYHFDSEEAINRLGLNEVKVQTTGKNEKVNKVKNLDDKKKGRPKKDKKFLEIETNDLFAELISSAEMSSVSEPIAEEISTPRLITNLVMENNECEIKKEQEPELEASPKVKKEPEASPKVKKEPALKVKKEPAPKVKKDQEKSDKELKKDQEKSDKELKKDQEKADKEALKAKKDQEKADKEIKKVQEKADNELKKVEEKSDKETKKDEDEEYDEVKKFEYEGIKYLKSKKSGIIYNMEQDVIGKWNEATKKIDFEEMEEEEDEAEYDE